MFWKDSDLILIHYHKNTRRGQKIAEQIVITRFFPYCRFWMWQFRIKVNWCYEVAYNPWTFCPWRALHIHRKKVYLPKVCKLLSIFLRTLVDDQVFKNKEMDIMCGRKGKDFRVENVEDWHLQSIKLKFQSFKRESLKKILCNHSVHLTIQTFLLWQKIIKLSVVWNFLGSDLIKIKHTNHGMIETWLQKIKLIRTSK